MARNRFNVVSISPDEKKERARAKKAAYYQANKEKIKARTKERYAANKESAAEYNARYYLLNKDKLRERNIEWKKNNPERKKELDSRYRSRNKENISKSCREYRLRHKERLLEKEARDRMLNPDKYKVLGSRRRARVLGADGHHKEADIALIRKMQKDKCAYCRAPLMNAGHLDHIIPISRGGSNWPKNLQLVCQPCNQSKYTKDPIKFAQERGMLL